jgi:hypothetical protein
VSKTPSTNVEDDKPKVRRIVQSEPVEPVDVLAVAGPAIARRAIPVAVAVAAALLAIVVMLRVRRAR